MRARCLLLLVFCIIAVTLHAQNDPTPSLHIGDPAPPLRVREWLKGTPIQRFEKGKVYVVEFWATWCAPCRAAMPHLSNLAEKYKGKVSMVGIDVMEMKTTTIGKVKAFVDSMGNRMNYTVAIEDSNFMATAWLDAAGEPGIPSSFVVDAAGKVAWIGSPKELDEVLPKIVNNNWDIQEALAQRNLNKHLAALDDSLNYELFRYRGDPHNLADPGKPDSALLAIHEIVRNEPRLKYAPFIAYNTFSSLLKTDPHSAYEYGKAAIVTPTYMDPPYDFIIGCIEWNIEKSYIPKEIYQLGAEAYQLKIDHIPYPELANLGILYHKMAGMYLRAKNKSKAMEAMQKAIEALKDK